METYGNMIFRIALGFFVNAYFLIVISYFMNNWLVKDSQESQQGHPSFQSLGLLEVCLNNDNRCTRCIGMLDKDGYLIPDFVIKTNIFFKICFLTLMLAGRPIPLLIFCERDDNRYVFWLFCTGVLQIASSICGLKAILTFGAGCDESNLLANWEHNKMGWSFVLALVGVMMLTFSGVLFIVEGFRELYKRLSEIDSVSITVTIRHRNSIS